MKLTTAALALATTALFATSAQAGVMSDDTTVKADAQSMTTRTVKTIDADGNVGMITVQAAATDMRRTAVLGAFEVQNTDAYIVEDNEGDLYINHLVPVEDLQEVDQDFAVVDSYTFEHRGMTFTNRIVAE
ncbi:MAG: hypothetical protein WBF53_16480 [Litorimonas sp.]